MAEQSSPGAGGDAPGAAQIVQGELRPIWPAPPSPEATAGQRWATSARIAASVSGLLFFLAAWDAVGHRDYLRRPDQRLHPARSTPTA